MLDNARIQVENDCKYYGYIAKHNRLMKNREHLDHLPLPADLEYERLEALTEVNGNPWASVAELKVLDASGSPRRVGVETHCGRWSLGPSAGLRRSSRPLSRSATPECNIACRSNRLAEQGVNISL